MSDTDEEFAMLIKEEFGENVGPSFSEPKKWFSMSDAIENTEPDEPAKWNPEPEPISLSKRAGFAAGMFIAAAVLIVLLWARMLNPGFWVMAVLFFGAGIAVSLTLIPKDNDPRGDGGLVL